MPAISVMSVIHMLGAGKFSSQALPRICYADVVDENLSLLVQSQLAPWNDDSSFM